MKELIEITFPIHPDLAPELIAFYQQLAARSTTAPVPVVKTTPPAAPTMSAPAAPAPTANGLPAAQLDSTGVPFNPSIHAPSGRLSAKGEWTLKKGVDKVAADAWKKQHAGTSSVLAAPVAAPAPAALNAQFGAPAWPLMPAAYPPVDYNTFGNLYAKLANEGKITGEHVAAIMSDVGVTDPQTFVTDDAKRAHAFALLQKFNT